MEDPRKADHRRGGRRRPRGVGAGLDFLRQLHISDPYRHPVPDEPGHDRAYGRGAAPKFTGGQLVIGQSYIDVQDLWFTANGSSYALFVFNGTTTNIGNQVKRCEFGPHTGTGGLIMGVTGGVVEDCYFHDVWSNVEYPSGTGVGCFFTTGSDNTEIRYNVVRNCYKGIMSGNVHRSLNIHHNIVDKCRVNGIDMSGGGVAGAPARIVNNFVWHRPTTPNGHGIDTQASMTGHYSRNNIVYCDYDGAAGNVELFCIDSTTYPDGDYDYNLGWIKPGTSGANYGKLGTTEYATLADFQTALAGTSYAGKEAHSLSVDPLIADLDGLVFALDSDSPAIDAGVTVGGTTDLYLGEAPDLGAYEVAQSAITHKESCAVLSQDGVQGLFAYLRHCGEASLFPRQTSHFAHNSPADCYAGSSDAFF